MKRSVYFIILILSITACDVVIVEPVHDIRDDIVGTWVVDEYSETYNVTTYFDIRILKSFDYIDEIFIRNFYDVNIEIRAFVDGNRITIPFQTRDGYEIEGSGTIKSDRITFIYSVFDTIDGGHADYCNSIAR